MIRQGEKFFNTLESISIFWDHKNVCSLNLTWCFVQMPCALAHKLVEQPKKYCCVRFKICWPGHLLTQNMQDQFSFHKNVWSFDLILLSARQFISYLLLPSLSVLSETFVDLSCLARHWKKTQNRYYKSNSRLLEVHGTAYTTLLKCKWPMLEIGMAFMLYR